MPTAKLRFFKVTNLTLPGFELGGSKYYSLSKLGAGSELIRPPHLVFVFLSLSCKMGPDAVVESVEYRPHVWDMVGSKICFV